MNTTQRNILRGSGLLAASALLLAGPAHAAVTPNAGSILQQVQPKRAPAPSGTGTGLRIERPKAGVSASKVRFAVKRIEISGNTLFATSVLHALVANGEGKKLTLSDLQRLAAHITAYYHRHGYSLSRAVIPAQTVSDGVVRIEVVEAHFGKVSLDNQSRVRHGLLPATLAPLKRGAIISDRALDHTMLLLSDIPGVAVEGTLRPGQTVGTSDLDVTAKATAPVTGYLSLDDYGNSYTGRARAGGGVTFFNPLHFGDELSANVLTSGKGLDYGRIGYDSIINGSGTRLGAAYSALYYALGGSLSNLKAHGSAQVATLRLRQPFVRGRRLNLYGRLRFDEQFLRDHVDVSSIRTDRNLGSWTATLNGDVRDRLLGRGAVTAWSVAWTAGDVHFEDASAKAADAATANTAGNFSKWDVSLSRLQGLGPKTSLYLLLSGQWTNDNLDSAEKLGVGGPYDVRAYDVGALSADTGYRGTLELRRLLGHGLQAKLFYDAEHVRVNRHPWATGANTAALQGVGIGLDWFGPKGWHIEGTLATPLGSRPTLLDSRDSVRGWLQVVKVF